MSRRKLVLAVVDSLRTDKLLAAAADGSAPTFAALLERGTLIGDCVSSYPSVTPVCTSEITTGARPDRHFIPGMNWYHRTERRYVEYGSSWEATRTFGLFSALYDTVYNLNMGHLSHEVETVFERLGDAGVRTACTPFLIYRGRTRHELGLEGVLRAAATAAKFHHAVWGPDELFYGELYASRKVPCRPTLARPNTRDAYSGCVGKELVERDLYDFMLFSLPDNDYHSHRFGPDATGESIARADESLAQLANAAGGLEAFLETNAVIVVADHSQSDVDRPISPQEILGERWEVLQPNDDRPELAELAVGPSSRAAGVWVLREGARGASLHAGVRARLSSQAGIDVLSWLAGPDGEPIARDGVAPPPPGSVAVVERGGRELRFRPGATVRDRRDAGWDVEGDLDTLELAASGSVVDSPNYPDALGRLWAAHSSPYAADVLLSAAPGWEFVDWGGTTHIPGGSHGSLHAIDSLGPLLTVGLDAAPAERGQWAISDVAKLVLGHFGIGPGAGSGQAAVAAASGGGGA